MGRHVRMAPLITRNRNGTKPSLAAILLGTWERRVARDTTPHVYGYAYGNP